MIHWLTYQTAHQNQEETPMFWFANFNCLHVNSVFEKLDVQIQMDGWNMTSIDPATRLYGLIMAGTIPHEPAQDAERFEIWREKVSWHMAQQGRGGVKFI